jgi:hypothetical protein
MAPLVDLIGHHAESHRVPATIKSGQAGGAGSSRQIATSVSNLTLNQNL